MKSYNNLIFFLIFVQLNSLINVKATFQTKEDLSEYGLDVSYPIQHYIDGKISPFFKKRYESLMEGCYKEYSKRECDATERARLEMSLSQPKLHHNYTKLGFKKIKTPKDAWEPLIQFYEKHNDKEHLESWPRAYTYVNTWESPSYMVSFEDSAFREGQEVKKLIWDACKPVLEEWTGKKVEPTSLYGIRVYHDKAILATHVDRLPLVSSAIINVAQIGMNSPWPVEVYDHDGQAHNVTMEPGDMVLYESHTVLHGRPFPMNGSLYANVFVHYKPIDHDEMNERDRLIREGKLDEAEDVKLDKQPSISRVFSRNAVGTGKFQKIGGHEQDQHEDHEIQKHLDAIDREHAREQEILINEKTDPISALHYAAGQGKLEMVERLLKENSVDLINSVDSNDWQALHEAVRGNQYDVVKYLVEMGADIGSKVAGGNTALSLARKYLDSENPIIEYLVSIGAPEGEESL